MACNTTRSNCTPANTFIALAPQGICSQFANPVNFQAEQIIYDAAYRDLINNFGVPINFYVNTFNMLSADLIYGEQPTSQFAGPYELQMYVELTENAINLSKFGFASDDELTGFLHIETFTSVMGAALDYSLLSQLIEPKSGDIIELTSLGCDRPNGRGSKWFEITERVDQDVASLNPMQGHYIYRIKAKRYESSFERGLSGERANAQISDDSPNYKGIYINSILISNAGQATSNGLYTRLSGGSTTFNGPNYNTIQYMAFGPFPYYYAWGLYDWELDDWPYANLDIGNVSGWYVSGVYVSGDQFLPIPTIVNTFSNVGLIPLSYDVDKVSQTEVFNMSANNTDIYGTYY